LSGAVEQGRCGDPSLSVAPGRQDVALLVGARPTNELGVFTLRLTDGGRLTTFVLLRRVAEGALVRFVLREGGGLSGGHVVG
jgi:hypothetical protein